MGPTWSVFLPAEIPGSAECLSQILEEILQWRGLYLLSEYTLQSYLQYPYQRVNSRTRNFMLYPITFICPQTRELLSYYETPAAEFNYWALALILTVIMQTIWFLKQQLHNFLHYFLLQKVLKCGQLYGYNEHTYE